MLACTFDLLSIDLARFDPFDNESSDSDEEIELFEQENLSFEIRIQCYIRFCFQNFNFLARITLFLDQNRNFRCQMDQIYPDLYSISQKYRLTFLTIINKVQNFVSIMEKVAYCLKV